MHLDPDELLDELAALAKTRRVVAYLDREAVLDATAEAHRLAAARQSGSAPAAVLFAFGRRSARFGPAGRLFVATLMQAQAIATGHEVEMDEIEFKILCARIGLGQIEFPELQAWIATRLRPFGAMSKRKPPKRPR